MSITSYYLPTAGQLVFQCRGCKTILSDSTEFACTLQAPGDGARLVCLQGATDARIDRIATTTAAPHSVHFAVCCQACGAAVGRLYTQGPPELSATLNLICLDISRCLSYELGTADMRAPGAPAAGSRGAAAAAAARQQQGMGGNGGGGRGGDQQLPAVATAGGAAAAEAAADPTLVLDLMQRVEHLEATICAMQGMQLMHDAQLRGLAGYQGDTAAAAAHGGS